MSRQFSVSKTRFFSLFHEFFELISWQSCSEGADVSEKIFAFCPTVARSARLSWLSGISSLTSITALSFLWAVARDVSYFSASKTCSLPHRFFLLFDRKSIYVHCIWVFHFVLNLLIVWMEKSSSHMVRRLSAILSCLAKYGHLSSVVVVQLDHFVFPALNGRWNVVAIQYFLEERSVQDFLI